MIVGSVRPEGATTSSNTRRTLLGVVAAVVTLVVLTAGLLPVRDHLSIATAALVLVVPVVVGVASGGFSAGVISVALGFLVYDYFFIPPYRTLKVGATENWAALGVYAIVMIPIARLVATMITARAQAQERGVQLRRLLDVSAQLIEDRPLEELLPTIASTLRDTFDARQVALLLPREDRLEIVASAGEPLTAADRARIEPLLGELATASAARTAGDQPFGLALVAAGRPVGLLAVSGAALTEQQREPLLLFANQAALAVERAQLREQALRAELTDELTRLAGTLVAAVSHDLRSPLAAIKAASSVLVDQQLAARLHPHEHQELASLIDTQADRLAGLVTNLLDMGRVQAGVLQPRTGLTTVSELVRAAVDALPLPPRVAAPRVDVPATLPPVDVDAVLITRVLVNLLDNAYRHSPKDVPVVIAAEACDEEAIMVSVTDHGPGVSPDRRSEVFGFYVRRSQDSGTGLGLAIAKTFIDAHDQRIWVETAPGGGARFCFTLPTAQLPVSAA
jgi:two-component system sensor histidine kinase KdpD